MANIERTEKTEVIQVKAKDKNYHSNSIVDSRQEYSLLEKKMMYFAINQLDISPENVQRDLFNDICFKIPVSAFGEDYSFKTLKIAINKITNRSITGGDNKKQHAFSINPFPFAELKNGVVELVMYSKAVPLFIDLKTRGYTSYELDIALSLKSVYSQRLYELLGRFKDTGKWHVEIDRLKFLLGIDKEKTFNGPLANGRLKEIVIEPSMKELAEKTEIEFDYCFEKTGRKFTAITFFITTKAKIKFIETADLKQSAREYLGELIQANKGVQMVALHNALNEYTFTEPQKKEILNNDQKKIQFLELDTQIKMGAVEIRTTKTRYVASILFKIDYNNYKNK